MYFWHRLIYYFSRKQPLSQRIYLDHASATPMFQKATKAMQPYLREKFANASAIHSEGRKAKEALELAREKIARVLQVRDEHIVFTSGGTESNNLAILGYLRTLHETGRPYEEMSLLTTAIEHPATLQACAEAELLGVRIKYLPLNEVGQIDLDKLPEVISADTVLVSVAHINSEIGVVQPTQAIARKLRQLAKTELFTTTPLLHIDAAQSPLWYKCELDRLGADMLSLDAAKCGGPKGVGVLAFFKKRSITHGILFGGGQEYGLRPGTEPVALIVGAKEALLEAQATCEERSITVRKVLDETFSYLKKELPEVEINGPQDETRAPYNINFSVSGYDTEYLALVLDAQGVAVSTKSACSSVDSDVSNVVYQLSKDKNRAKSTLRLTLREEITKSAMKQVVGHIREHLDKMKPYNELTRK